MAAQPQSGHDADLAEVISARGRMFGLRVGVALIMLACYGPTLGYGKLAGWITAYLAIQGVEQGLGRSFQGRLYGWPRVALLGSLFVGAVVFGAVAPALSARLGAFGPGCAAFLIAGALLTGLQTTAPSPAAFLVLSGPFFAYAMALPLMGSASGGTLEARLGMELGAMLTSLYSLAVWRQARRARNAEMHAVTELRRREAEARTDRNFLDTVVEHMPAMLVVKEVATGRYRMVNHAAELMLGRTRTAMVGRTDHEVFSREAADVFVAGDLAFAANLQPLVSAVEQVVTDGGVKDLRIQKTLLRGSGGSDLVLVMGEDVTEALATARALEAAVEAAEAASHAKSAFLATMSHEVRTPLNGVLGMAQAMAADELSPMQRERVETIRQAGDLLLAVLNDILDLSKIEAGKLELELVDFDLAELVKGARSAFTDMAHRKGLSFGLAVSAEAQGCYRGDSVRLRQILYNLISNAVKFTDVGEVRVTVAEDQGVLSFRVSDTGLGMTADQVGRLFAKFQQGDVSTTRRFGGTGLGLAICRELAQMMGGDIEVESVLEHGSSFTLRLSLERVVDGRDVGPRAATAAPEALSAPSSLRVLAAEDNAMNQLVLKALLHQVGIQPVVVENGRLALEAWAREPWDVVLMDMHMPEMDGLAATAAIRAAEASLGRPRTPIIALTANAMAHHLADYARRGMDEVVAKPIEAAQLFAALERALNQDDEAPSIEVQAA